MYKTLDIVWYTTYSKEIRASITVRVTLTLQAKFNYEVFVAIFIYLYKSYDTKSSIMRFIY